MNTDKDMAVLTASRPQEVLLRILTSNAWTNSFPFAVLSSFKIPAESQFRIYFKGLVSSEEEIMPAQTINDRIAAALTRLQCSERDLAAETGISQFSISQIVSGQKTPTISEVMLITEALGLPFDQLSGSQIADRVEVAARSTNSSAMDEMRAQLVQLLEIEAHLTDMGL
ncbi:helix-turn-helix domain-containing protein [Corynebacterium phocae]|nr:helix-turn-helix transcriptional regulator [Corynebacterium phocae]